MCLFPPVKILICFILSKILRNPCEEGFKRETLLRKMFLISKSISSPGKNGLFQRKIFAVLNLKCLTSSVLILHECIILSYQSS